MKDKKEKKEKKDKVVEEVVQSTSSGFDVIQPEKCAPKINTSR